MRPGVTSTAATSASTKRVRRSASKKPRPSIERETWIKVRALDAGKEN